MARSTERKRTTQVPRAKHTYFVEQTLDHGKTLTVNDVRSQKNQIFWAQKAKFPLLLSELATTQHNVEPS